jgi:hypothetical protein
MYRRGAENQKDKTVMIRAIVITNANSQLFVLRKGFRNGGWDPLERRAMLPQVRREGVNIKMPATLEIHQVNHTVAKSDQGT